MNSSTQLSQFEKALKNYYLQNGPNYTEGYLEKFLDSQLNEEYRNIVNSIQSTELLDSYFFKPDELIVIYRHYKYLPLKIHKHNFFEFIYVYTGNAVNYIGDKTIEMNEGDICILSPNTEHAIGVFSDDSVIYNILIKTDAFEADIFGLFSQNDVLSTFFSNSILIKLNSYIYFETFNDIVLKQYINYAIKEYQLKRKYRERMITNLVSALFITLLRNHDDKSTQPHFITEPHNKKVVEIIQYIHENYSTVTLYDVASYFSYSERHISRLIFQYSEQSFTSLITDIRLGKAKNLLRNTKLPVMDIANFVGYQDQSNFYRIFKKKFSVTPSSFRNNLFL